MYNCWNWNSFFLVCVNVVIFILKKYTKKKINVNVQVNASSRICLKKTNRPVTMNKCIHFYPFRINFSVSSTRSSRTKNHTTIASPKIAKQIFDGPYFFDFVSILTTFSIVYHKTDFSISVFCFNCLDLIFMTIVFGRYANASVLCVPPDLMLDCR